MGKRVRLNDGGIYFNRDVSFISSGCTILDAALGGGWARKRVVNIVGDASTGKTLLAIEAAANFHRLEPKGVIHYAEGEAAFDKSYAHERLGLPKDRLKFYEDENAIHTVEDWHDLMSELLSGRKRPQMFILDSLDSLTDRSEDKRDFGEGTYGTAKAKLLSEFFRRNIKSMRDGDLTLLVVSQTRAAIGVRFGSQKNRSGGKALDFYSSQIVWLAQTRKIVQTRKKTKRTVGIEVKARVTKNKVAPPFREALFPIRFDYGVEDAQASLKWLIDHGRAKDLDLTAKAAASLLTKIPSLNGDEYQKLQSRIQAAVLKAWDEVESDFRPVRKKYT